MDIYIRVSRLGDRDEDEGTEVYEARLRDWADRNEVQVDEVVDETDVSGSVAVRKRKLERLVKRVEAGESDGILTPYIDRFGRDLIEGALALKRIAEAGGKLVAVHDGFDSTSPGSELVFNLRMAIAQDYLNRVRENWKAANDRAVERGVWLAPRIPFGYDKNEEKRLTVNEAEAAVVREAFERRTRGEGFSALTRWMRSRCSELGLERGSKISRTGVRRMIGNRVYLGEVKVAWGRPDDPLEVPDSHPPILTESVWQAAQYKHPFSPRNGRASTARLRGLVYCATCGKRCKVGASGPSDRRKTNYVCTSEGCSARPAILTEKLDGYVEGVLMQAAADHEPHVAAVILGDTRYQDATTAVEDARRTLDEYRDSIETQRALGMAEFAKGISVRKEALRVARRELAAMRPPASGAPAGARPPETREQVEAAIDARNNARFIDRVVLKPTGGGPLRPTHERADIYWVGAALPHADRYAS